MEKIACQAEIVLEQNKLFEFTLRKNRFGNSGYKVSSETVGNMFKDGDRRKVVIINDKGKVLSQNF